MSCNSEITETSIDLVIKDFSSVIGPNSHGRYEKEKRCGHYIFCVSMISRGFDLVNKDYMFVNVNETRNSELSMSLSTFDILRWTVSVIDVNGIGKYFVSSHRVVDFLSRRDVFYRFYAEKYLKLSFLLEHADELLEDVLTLRFDISYVSCAGRKEELKYEQPLRKWEEIFNLPANELLPIDLIKENEDRQSESLLGNRNVEIEKNNIISHFALDTSFENNDRNTVNNESSSKESGCKVDENYWTIRTNTAKFAISLIKSKDTYGNKLVSASPVFKCMMNIDMKEKHTKYIDLSHIEFEIFLTLLDYLRKGILINDFYFDVQKLYALAHMYMMEEIQYVCAAYIARSLNCVIILVMRKVLLISTRMNT
ncbi:BTB domain-containing protein [Trichonephila clavata]|uniref:BTB domain-containing protein n=1 Tax=Trichonephila clavata TaxID=2740835 RepID=A0A8X6HVK1_TRICU|nr:BTB domain-containing protein [Trichonephila clavata]